MQHRSIVSQIVEAFAEFDKWWRIAIFALKRQYSTTILGPLWLFLPHFLFIAAVATVYGKAFDVEGKRYYAYVALGYVLWIFIVDSFSRGANVFVAEYGRFSQMRTNLFGVILKDVIARSIILVVNLTICVVVLAVVEGEVKGLGWAVMGLALLFANSFMQSYWLSALVARFRDLGPIVNSGMRLMLLITPIFWFADAFKTGYRILFLHANPFYYMIEIVRQPLMEGHLGSDIACLALGWSAANLIVFAVVAASRHPRIIYDAA